MTSVHPSRMGMVPGATDRPREPPRELLPRSPTRSRRAAPIEDDTVSREEELKRRLIERRRGKEPENGSTESERPVELSIKGKARQVGSEERDERSERRHGEREYRSRSRGNSYSPEREDRRSGQYRDDERDRDRYHGSRRDFGEWQQRQEERYGRRDERDRRRYDSPRERSPHSARPSLPLRPHGPPAGEPRTSGPSSPRRGHDAPPHLSGPTPSSLPPLRFGFDTPSGSATPNNGSPPPWLDASKTGMPPFPPKHHGFGGRYTAADLERRRQERESKELSIWPQSPERPYQDEDELALERRAKKDKKKSKRSKRRSKYSDSDSGTESSDSEYERRRRRRKEKERERRRRHESEDESEYERRKRKRRATASKTRSPSPRRSRQPSLSRSRDATVSDSETHWVERGHDTKRSTDTPDDRPLEEEEDGDGDDEVGPKLPVELKEKHRARYQGMLYGEAEAMAAYAAEGKRIPRRGEIGMDVERIEAFEQSGYVMSGNRNKRMTAVRLRKENQVINEEEKRALLKLQREEKVRKEGAIVSQFREMLEEKLRESNQKM